MSDVARDALVRQMREQIVDNDIRIIAAINRRLELVARLREYKEAHGMAFVDQSREAWMHQYLQGVNRGPLSEEGLHDIFEALLELTKSETGDHQDDAG